MEQELLNQREQIQQDLICLLDGADDELISNACQIVVDRFAMLLKMYKDISNG